MQDIVLDWIMCFVEPSKRINHAQSSYVIKHMLEDDTGVYLSDSQFVLAMRMSGYDGDGYFKIKLVRGACIHGYDDNNVTEAARFIFKTLSTIKHSVHRTNKRYDDSSAHCDCRREFERMYGVDPVGHKNRLYGVAGRVYEALIDRYLRQLCMHDRNKWTPKTERYYANLIMSDDTDNGYRWRCEKCGHGYFHGIENLHYDHIYLCLGCYAILR